MALLPPVPGSTITQRFGPSPLWVEPSMYVSGDRAWWQPFGTARLVSDFHAAVDFAAPEGSPILASEDGIVVQSYFDRDYGGGNKVRVQIREDVYYTSNHMKERHVGVGEHVDRGRRVGLVGHTGWAVGDHNHFEVGIDDAVGSDIFPTLYDPQIFLPGGRLADDSRIKPIPFTERRQLNGPDINIRLAPPSFDDLPFAVAHKDGIYRLSTGKRLGPLTYAFTKVGYNRAGGVTFVIVIGFGRRLAIANALTHVV